MRVSCIAGKSYGGRGVAYIYLARQSLFLDTDQLATMQVGACMQVCV